ncbi:uncharacterized protein RJT21DRAFT_120718 [Scheffersomyces amazonensis]|uniref:uncharacterized protein n=1 Tax=Scheffersomyces amazonensis TaxID=1078765 RepID=UPI00315C9FBD
MKSKQFSLKKFSLSSFRKTLKSAHPNTLNFEEEPSPLISVSGFNVEESRNNLSYGDIDIKQTKNSNDERCAFCHEMLSLSLPGETIIPLTCLDQCHEDCLVASFDTTNLTHLPICGACNQPTRSLDESNHSNIIQRLLLTNNPIEVTQVYYSEDEKVTEIGAYGVDDNNNDDSKDSYYDDLISNILNPRVQCYSDLNRLKISANSTYKLDYLISLKSPLVYQKNEPTVEEIEIRSKLVDYFKTTFLQNIQDTNGEIGFIEELGDLLMFDYFHISTNATSWDWMCCYLFEDMLLLIGDGVLVGQLSVSKDICGVNRTTNEDILAINLRTEVLPELYLKSNNKLVLLKWESVLIDLYNSNASGRPNLFQFTTNAWQEVWDSGIELSEDVKNYSHLAINGKDIPSKYLIQALPEVQPLPLNLVVSVPLYNNTSLTDNDLKQELVRILRNIKELLRPIDKLALIFVGTYQNRNPKDKSTFIGFMPPEWKDWEEVFNDIVIIPKGDQIFKTEWNELMSSFQKCQDLYSLIPESNTEIHKLLVLNLQSKSEDIELTSLEVKKLSQIIDDIAEKISISIIRIGNDYTNNLENLTELLAVIPQDRTLSTKFSNPIKRYNSFGEFIDGIPKLIHNLQSICIPKLTLELKVDKLFGESLTISEVEINGSLKKFTDIDSLRILIQDIGPLYDRNILLKVKLYVSNRLYKDLQYEDLDIVKYDYSWLKFSEGAQSVSLKLSKSNFTEIMEESTSTLPNFINSGDSTIQFLNIPLLPPLSSTREPAFSRRQAELSVIDALKSTRILNASQCQDVLLNSISLMYAMMSLSNGNSNTQRLRNIFETVHSKRDYIQNLEEELKHISDLFIENSSMAYTHCQDLVYFLM